MLSLAVSSPVPKQSPKPRNCSEALLTDATLGKLLQIPQSKNLSQLLRSNSPHFWAYLRKIMQNPESLEALGLSDEEKSVLSSLLQFSGIVTGDPHVGNFSVTSISVTSISSPEASNTLELKPTYVDFDDAGQGPLFFDLLRFIVATEGTNPNIKTGDLLKAYINGLTDPSIDWSKAPEFLQKIIATPSQKIISAEQAMAEKKSLDAKKTAQRRFKMASDLRELPSALRSKYLDELNKMPSVQQLGTVLDIVKKEVERGGSRDATRFYLLVENKIPRGLNLRIYEAKQIMAPGTASFEQQPKTAERWSALRTFFWQETQLDPSYQIVELDKTDFYLRPKQIDWFEAPDEFKEFSQWRELVLWDAYYLAHLHRANPEFGATWATTFSSQNTPLFKKILEAFRDDYIAKVLQQAPKFDK